MRIQAHGKPTWACHLKKETAVNRQTGHCYNLVPSYRNSLNFLLLNSVTIQESRQAPCSSDSDWLFSTQSLRLLLLFFSWRNDLVGISLKPETWAGLSTTDGSPPFQANGLTLGLNSPSSSPTWAMQCSSAGHKTMGPIHAECWSTSRDTFYLSFDLYSKNKNLCLFSRCSLPETRITVNCFHLG